MLKKIYLSPFGFVISVIMNIFGFIHKPFMVYGYYNHVSKRFNKHTRISSSTYINNKKKLDIGDNTWVWHYTLLDSSNGIKIGQGCQIGAHVGIFSHSSHLSIRLLGEKYIELNKDERIGYVSAPVEIGEYTFIGSSVIINPGIKIGKGCIVTSGSVVTLSVPDYTIVSGNPAKVISTVDRLDREYYKNELVKQNYFDKDLIDVYFKKLNNQRKYEESQNINKN